MTAPTRQRVSVSPGTHAMPDPPWADAAQFPKPSNTRSRRRLGDHADERGLLAAIMQAHLRGSEPSRTPWMRMDEGSGRITGSHRRDVALPPGRSSGQRRGAL